jgi:hypothetical protein
VRNGKKCINDAMWADPAFQTLITERCPGDVSIQRKISTIREGRPSSAFPAAAPAAGGGRSPRRARTPSRAAPKKKAAAAKPKAKKAAPKKKTTGGSSLFDFHF